MKALFLKKSLKGAVAGVLMAFSATSHALIPTTDFATLAETMAGNFQQLSSWVEEKALMMSGMELDKILNQFTIDNTNNAMANMIVRTISAEQNMHNLEITQQSRPSKNSCSATYLTQVHTDNQCALSESKGQLARKEREKVANFKTSSIDNDIKNKEVLKETITTCEILQDPKSVVDPENPLATSLCLDAGILVGTSTGKTRNQNEQDAADLMIDIMTGVIEPIKRSQKYTDGKRKDAAINKEMRDIILRDLARKSIREVESIRRSPTGEMDSPSELHLLTLNINQFYHPKTVMQIANADPLLKQEKSEVTETMLLRDLLVLEGFRAKLQLMQYENQMRSELLQATMLLLDSKE